MMGRVFDLDAWACATARYREAAGRPWAEGKAGRIYCADCAARIGLLLELGGLVSLPEIRCDSCGARFMDERVERSHVFGQGDHKMLDAAIRAAWADGWRGGPHRDVDALRAPHPDRESSFGRVFWTAIR